MSRLGDERGWALVTAMLVMALLIAFGLATYAFVDGQQAQSRVQREHDSSFNLAEGALNQEAFIVSRQWPTATNPAPSCSSASQGARCPDAAWLASSFTARDYAAGTSWSVQVLDNAPDLNYYQEGTTNGASAARYDANGDNLVWLRAQATVRGRKRTLVAQLRQQRTSEAAGFPRNVITAGRLATTNLGKKVIIDTKGPSAAAAPVKVRCNPQTDNTCLVYQPSKGQISPDTTQGNYNDGGHAIPADLVDRLRARAQADGTYYPTGTCPASPAGGMVFIENANCTWPHVSNCCNSATAPGVLFVYSGSVAFTGNDTFYGMIYDYNAQGSSLPNLVNLGGNTTVQGAIVVDGNGGVYAGSNKVNLVYDDRYLFQDNVLFSYGSAGVVQNTWREVSAP
jgi:hypothetical protein